MTWKEIKDKIESLGINDNSDILCIDIMANERFTRENGPNGIDIFSVFEEETEENDT